LISRRNLPFRRRASRAVYVLNGFHFHANKESLCVVCAEFKNYPAFSKRRSTSAGKSASNNIKKYKRLIHSKEKSEK